MHSDPHRRPQNALRLCRRLPLQNLLVPWLGLVLSACGDAIETRGDEGVAAVVDGRGAIVRAPADSEIAGVQLTVPPGVFETPTRLILRPASDDTALPARAHAVGPQVELVLEETRPAPMGTLSLTLPFADSTGESYGQDHRKVKVWRRVDAAWLLTEPVSTAPGRVTIETAEESPGTIYAAGVKDDPPIPAHP